jgi:hypothetical protein
MANGAFAQTVPTPPADPVGATPLGINSTLPNGGLVLSVWAPGPASTTSLMYYTGLTYDQVSVDDIGTNVANNALVVDFGTIPNWSTVSSTPGLVYSLIAVDGFGSINQLGFSATAPLFSTLTGNNGDINGIVTNWGSNIGPRMNACIGTTIAGNPCTNSAAIDADEAAWGAQFGGYLDVSGAAAVGNPLGFYRVRGNNSGDTTPTGLARIDTYQNANGLFGTWLLSTSGALTYSFTAQSAPPVPLPAAAWLLLSGLAGFGVVSRRRNAA